MIAKNRNWHQRLELHRVFLFWEEVVGKDIARYAQPFVIRGDVLWVNVSDSIWMQQLHFQKCNLLAAINRRLGSGAGRKDNLALAEEARGAGEFADIRFRIEAVLTMPEPSPRLERPQAPPPDPERVRQFEEMLSAIGDDEVRQAMHRFWMKVERFQR